MPRKLTLVAGPLMALAAAAQANDCLPTSSFVSVAPAMFAGTVTKAKSSGVPDLKAAAAMGHAGSGGELGKQAASAGKAKLSSKVPAASGTPATAGVAGNCIPTKLPTLK